MYASSTYYSQWRLTWCCLLLVQQTLHLIELIDINRENHLETLSTKYDDCSSHWIAQWFELCEYWFPMGLCIRERMWFLQHLPLEPSNFFPNRSGQQLVEVINYSITYSMYLTTLTLHFLHSWYDWYERRCEQHTFMNYWRTLCVEWRKTTTTITHIDTLIECWRIKINWLQQRRADRPTGKRMCTHHSHTHTYKCHGHSDSIKSSTSNVQITENIWYKSFTKQHAMSFSPTRIFSINFFFGSNRKWKNSTKSWT